MPDFDSRPPTTIIIDEECPLVWCAELTQARTEAQNVVAGRHVCDCDQSRTEGEIDKFTARAKAYIYRHLRALLQTSQQGVGIRLVTHSGFVR